MKTIRTFAPLALALALACGGGGETPSEENGAGGEEVVAAPRVTGAEARQLVADGALLLDVTPEQRAAESEIPGRTHIPLPELEARMSELPRDQLIVVYCFGGRGSPRAGAMLQAEGYDVRVMGARRHWDEAAPVDEATEQEAPVEDATEEAPAEEAAPTDDTIEG